MLFISASGLCFPTARRFAPATPEVSRLWEFPYSTSLVGIAEYRLSTEEQGVDTLADGYLALESPLKQQRPENMETHQRIIELATEVLADADRKDEAQNSTIREYRSKGRIRVFSEGIVDLDDVLTGFRLDVSELFS